MKKKYEIRKNIRHGRSGSEIGTYLKATLDPNKTFQNKPYSGFVTQRKPIVGARKNKFYIETQDKRERGSIKDILGNYAEPVSKTHNDDEMENLESSLVEGEEMPSCRKKVNSTSKAHRPRKTQYEKSLEKISNCFLKQIDNYFGQMETVEIPSSKIQLYTASINQPSVYSKAVQYKSIASGSEPSYDFFFEDEKKKRPKAPSNRKNLYERA